jgi:septal ring factor EnvC (AmiA/AmiB activator)
LIEEEVQGLKGQIDALERDLVRLEKEILEKRERAAKLERIEAIDASIEKLRSDQRYGLEKLDAIKRRTRRSPIFVHANPNRPGSTPRSSP